MTNERRLLPDFGSAIPVDADNSTPARAATPTNNFIADRRILI
jgi:hypothetical protein